ncbi:MAG TPA: hypothetical protein VNN20_00405 [Thermodesulfobacteriota bacterium]|nr:hypothetical protein [Thermodesulfobacteriota bacterium]
MRRYGSGKKMIWGLILSVLLIPLFITACAQTKGEFVKISTDIYPPKSEAQEILVTRSDAYRPYKEIGIVKAEGNQHTDEAACLAKISQIARESGADAVIKAHVEQRERLVSRQLTADKLRRTVKYKVKEPVCEGTAVVFTNNV